MTINPVKRKQKKYKTKNFYKIMGLSQTIGLEQSPRFESFVSKMIFNLNIFSFSILQLVKLTH